MCCEKVGKIVRAGDKKEFGGRIETVQWLSNDVRDGILRKFGDEANGTNESNGTNGRKE